MEIEKVFVSKKTFGKYTGTLEWCVKDDVWIDNCFKSTVTDRAGNILEIIDETRLIPEKIRPLHIIPPPIEGEPPLKNTGKLWYFDPLYPNEKYIFSPPLQKPITAWVIKVDDDIFIFDAETGKDIGRNVIKYVSATGSCPTCGGITPPIVRDWFPKLGFHIAHSLGIYDEVQEVLKDNNIKYWYGDAHGSSYGSQLYTAMEIQEAMANRSPMWVAILDHCNALKKTGPGTLSHAFRKGLMKGTVTIGLIVSGALGGRWLEKIFEKVYSGSTWKDGFDYASAARPDYGVECGFCGDSEMRLVGSEDGGPPYEPPPYEPPTKSYITCTTSPSGASIWLKKK